MRRKKMINEQAQESRVAAALELDVLERTEVDAAQRIVWHLGKRAAAIIKTIGIDISHADRADSIIFAKSKTLPLPLNNREYGLVFTLMSDPTRRLSNETEPIPQERKRTFNPIHALKKPPLEQRIQTALPLGVSVRIASTNAHGQTIEQSSELLSPDEPQDFLNKRSTYTRSDVGDFNTTPISETYGQPNVSINPGSRDCHDRMQVAAHIRACLRYAEYRSGILIPTEDPNELAANVYDVLAINRPEI